MAIIKTVSIKREHEEWLISNDVGLSRYLQEKIESDIAYERLKDIS